MKLRKVKTKVLVAALLILTGLLIYLLFGNDLPQKPHFLVETSNDTGMHLDTVILKTDNQTRYIKLATNTTLRRKMKTEGANEFQICYILKSTEICSQKFKVTKGLELRADLHTDSIKVIQLPH